MARKRLGIDEGLEILIKQLKDMDGNVKQASEKAVKKSRDYVNAKLTQDMKRHNKTNATINSLDKISSVSWVGSKASIPVGFNISKGGLASIFLMYGTPRIAKDQKLYNDILGNKIVKEIADIQAEVFFEEIGKLVIK